MLGGVALLLVKLGWLLGRTFGFVLETLFIGLLALACVLEKCYKLHYGN